MPELLLEIGITVMGGIAGFWIADYVARNNGHEIDRKKILPIAASCLIGVIVGKLIFQ